MNDNAILELGRWAAKELKVEGVTWTMKIKYEGKKPFVQITFTPSQPPRHTREQEGGL